MFIGRLALCFAIFLGVAATQVPAFTQQYRQRLGGAIDELAVVVADFDADSAKAGMSEDEGIRHLADSPDPFVQARGTQMQTIVGRLRRLVAQRDGFDTAGPVGRIVMLAGDVDARVARHAYESFQPGLPASWDGVVAGCIGFTVGGGLIHLLTWPFRSRKRLRSRAITLR